MSTAPVTMSTEPAVTSAEPVTMSTEPATMEPATMAEPTMEGRFAIDRGWDDE